MHVLTKIFIVLVSLLAVLLVPLVVVYAYNENSYKARFLEEELKAAAAQKALQQAEARAGADHSRLQAMIDEMRMSNTGLMNEKTKADVTIRQLESQLAASQTMQSEINSRLARITASIEAGQELTESLVAELRTLRADAVALERQSVELDAALRDVSSQLEVANQARRALLEEIAQLKNDHSKAMATLDAFYARYGGLEDVHVGARGAIIPDRMLTAKVIRVQRSSGQVLAEIDAGSRDGIKEGWSMTIGSEGEFIANLRIVNVDINRSTGVVNLESKERGLVQVGHNAYARAGEE